MIDYYKGAFGLNLLLRLHGSSLYKGAIPGLASVIAYIMLSKYYLPKDADGNPTKSVQHPLAIAMLISSISFLIIFRANFGIQRYWEGATSIHHMMSKWMDGISLTAVCHLQSDQYERCKPPTFGGHNNLNRLNLTRDRQGSNDGVQRKKSIEFVEPVVRRRRSMRFPSTSVDENRERTAEVTLDSLRDLRASVSKRGSDNWDDNVTSNQECAYTTRPQSFNEGWHGSNLSGDHASPENHLLLGPSRLDGGWGLLYSNDTKKTDDVPTSTYFNIYARGTTDMDGTFVPPEPFLWPDPLKDGFSSTRGGRTPALFLQELLHLSSLLCATAFSTLRNDVEGAQSPLSVYTPGLPWPEVDPGKIPTRKGPIEMVKKNVRYWLGMDRTAEARTRDNAQRPMPVIGGVSDAEIAFLQKARGPSAKVNLVWSWLCEFILREQLSGSMGKSGAPTISRIFQFLSDGMSFYNQSRKIMFIPFPFPHAQLTSASILLTAFVMPLLMLEFTSTDWLGCLLTFCTVTSLAALHEVARELENPFRNEPNDLPLCTLLAQFNETLITLYAGYHPDSYWDPNADSYVQLVKYQMQAAVSEQVGASDDELHCMENGLPDK